MASGCNFGQRGARERPRNLYVQKHPGDSYQVSSENATLRTGWAFEPFWWPHKYLCNVAVEEALEGIGCSSPSSRWGNRSDRFAKVTWPAEVGAGTVIQVSKWSVFNSFQCIYVCSSDCLNYEGGNSCPSDISCQSDVSPTSICTWFWCN